MRRRFGRSRRRNEDADRQPIDAAGSLARIVEAKVVEADALEPLELEGVAASFAALGQGEADGRPVAVSFSPRSGADAALAVLALSAQRRAADAPDAALRAVAPDWSASDRRMLSLLAPVGDFAAVAASALAERGVRVAAEVGEAPPCEPALVAGRLARPGDREVFARGLAGFEGLAAKHGGALRGADDRVELVVLSRRAASLCAEDGRVRIEVHEPERATLPLGAGDGLATALDRLEGLLRKLLNDRRLRTSEAGMRAALLPVLERAAEVATVERWPLAGDESAPLDFAALDASGVLVCGAIRETLDLPALSAILAAATAIGPVARGLERRAGRPARPGAPQLALAASELSPAALGACAAGGLSARWFRATTRRSGEWALEPLDIPQLAASAPAQREVRREPTREPAREPAEATAAGEGAAPAAAPAAARFDEVSLFDLDDEAASGSASAPSEGDSRRRRGRGRRRGRRGRGGETARGDRGGEERDSGEADAGDSEPGERRGVEAGGARRRSSRGGRRRAAPVEAEESDDDEPLLEPDDDALAPLAADAPELEEETEAAGYDDDDDDAGDEDAEVEKSRRERERRRRERATKPAEPPPPPRRRAAFLAHADPVSVLTAAVLARDVRLVESFRVYPQSELMTFFRSVATDLREDTPIFLVGFAASQPARDTLQTASLYRGRLDWFDHHEWPPEDLEALRATLGADHVHVVPGAECSLAAVIAARTRRSRFSDKLVELITGRFTQHDYERWGRWWWHRASEIAAKSGEQRAEIEPLLAGRPSDLAREVAKRPEPPLPPELSYVSERDFRIVHFGGFSMVVIEVPDGRDLHLAARIARERYEAQISLATRAGSELVVLGGDDSRTKRGLDLGGMTAHLATKHAWVEALPDDDHVARMRVTRLHDEPGRFDELITEIAMGRSIVEG